MLVSGLFNRYQLYRVCFTALPAPLPVPPSVRESAVVAAREPHEPQQSCNSHITTGGVPTAVDLFAALHIDLFAAKAASRPSIAAQNKGR
jgi:hypothetical protein